jgi:hypothetical protein
MLAERGAIVIRDEMSKHDAIVTLMSLANDMRRRGMLDFSE